MSLAFWICSGITAISALVSFCYAIAGLSGAEAASRTASMYAFSRSLALLVVALLALGVGRVPFAAAIAIVMIIVQGADAVVGAIDKDRLKTLGPAATAVLNLCALIWLLCA